MPVTAIFHLMFLRLAKCHNLRGCLLPAQSPQVSRFPLPEVSVFSGTDPKLLNNIHLLFSDSGCWWGPCWRPNADLGPVQVGKAEREEDLLLEMMPAVCPSLDAAYPETLRGEFMKFPLRCPMDPDP